MVSHFGKCSPSCQDLDETIDTNVMSVCERYPVEFRVLLSGCAVEQCSKTLSHSIQTAVLRFWRLMRLQTHRCVTQTSLG